MPVFERVGALETGTLKFPAPGGGVRGGETGLPDYFLNYKGAGENARMAQRYKSDLGKAVLKFGLIVQSIWFLCQKGGQRWAKSNCVTSVFLGYTERVDHILRR